MNSLENTEGGDTAGNGITPEKCHHGLAGCDTTAPEIVPTLVFPPRLKNRAGSTLWVRGRAGKRLSPFPAATSGRDKRFILLYSEMLPLRGLPMTFLCLRAHVLFQEGLLQAGHAPLAYQR